MKFKRVFSFFCMMGIAGNIIVSNAQATGICSASGSEGSPVDVRTIPVKNQKAVRKKEDPFIEKCKTINQKLPNFRYQVVKKGPVPGLCEFWAGTNVIYYWPDYDLLFIGEIWNTRGESLTQKSRNQLIAERVREIDLSKAIKWGRGPVKVILFTDPDCPFSQRVEKILFNTMQDTITTYIFLYPLKIHHGSREHAIEVLCSKDPVAKLLSYARPKITEGKKKPGEKREEVLKTCRIEAEKRLEAMISEGMKLGITGTPYVIIGNTVIPGAQLEKIMTTIAMQKADYERYRKIGESLKRK